MVRRCTYDGNSPGELSCSIIIRSFFFHLRVIYEGISFLLASNIGLISFRGDKISSQRLAIQKRSCIFAKETKAILRIRAAGGAKAPYRFFIAK